MQHTHIRYRPHVDGLRAVAILPVIFFHAGAGFSGGYVGVDIFFVISGYLISGLILKDLNAGHFHITEFWERRVRRILPALAVVVLASLVAGWFLFFPDDFKNLGRSMIAQALLVSNFYFYYDANYFAQGVDMKPLLHTWSLAVEEQFYLLFPFILIICRRISKKSTVPVIVLLSAGSFLLSVYSSYKHPRANFYLLPTRSWELLTGSFLAAIPTMEFSRHWKRESCSWIGLAAILYAIFFYNSDTRFPGATALLPCIGAALLIWSSDHTLTSVGKWLASRPMVFVGLISYSLYLWHWPVLVFYKYRVLGEIPMANRLFLLLLSIVLAILSWKFVETPFRKRVVFDKQWQIFSFGGITTAVLLLAGLGVYRLQGVPNRIPAEALKYLDGVSTVENGAGPGADREITLSDATRGDFNELGKFSTNQPIGLLVWGDSHAKVMMPVLAELCREHSDHGVAATHSQTAPLVDYDSEGVWSLQKDSIAYSKAVIDFVRTHHVHDVVIIARWDYYVDVEKGTDALHKDLVATTDALRKAGTRVWILRQVPKYPWNVPRALATEVLRGRNPVDLGMTTDEYRKQSQMQDPIFAGLETNSVTVLDPSSAFIQNSGRCLIAKDGRPLYYDSDHVNVAGAMMLRPIFEPIFKAADEQRTTGLTEDKHN